MIPIDLSGKVAPGHRRERRRGFRLAHRQGRCRPPGPGSSSPATRASSTSSRTFLTREADAPSRELPFGAGHAQVEKVVACDVSYDTMAT